MKKLSAFFLLALSITFSSCENNNSNTNVNSNTAEKAPVQKGVKPTPDTEVAVFEMADAAYGKLVIELYPNVAPKMVERFKTLIKQGFYNGVTFHRIDPNLGIIQGGDPLSKDANPMNDGTGDSELPDLPAEFSDIQYEAGTIGAARQTAPNTANCQFFIAIKRITAFDSDENRYTVFGKVIQGVNFASIIAGAPTATGTERPDPPIVIKSVMLEPRSNYVK